MTDKPIRRSEFLKPLSRDHHHGLLLSWKIRNGIKKGIALSRIKAYSAWFYQNYLNLHFEFEEKYIFSILGHENELVLKALTQHKTLKQLFESDLFDQEELISIANNLEIHIRFEERILFDEIQKIATPIQIRFINNLHSEEKFVDNPADPFWL